MNLQQIPTEVMKMYDPEHLTTNWAELVDLTKVNAADNDIEELNEDMFPQITSDDGEMNHQFLGLEILDLHRNRLTRLPQGLSMLERLHTLNLSGNKLTNESLDIISQIPKLRELFLADNCIEGELDLSRSGSNNCSYLENLEVLDLHGNAVSSFGAEGLLMLKNIRILNVAGNKLSCLDWQLLSMSTLTELNLSKNRFSGVLFSTRDLDFKELRNLDASYNDLTSLTSGDDEDGTCFSNIRTLNLTGNKVTSLPSFRSLTDLISLQLADNKLSEIPSGFAELESLKSADFANNDIRLIPAELATMANLTSINLVGNPLREKKYLTMGTTDLKLDLEKKLEPTEPGNNPSEPSFGDAVSTSQYRYAPSNGILDLSSQTLSAIPMELIDLTSEVLTLKLSNNELSSFPTDLLSHPSLKYSLQSLDLSHNPQLHPTDYLTSELFMPNLKSLYIVSTGLTSLDALTTHLRAPELREINISCHRLAGHVPWVRAWWPKVTTLLATDNWFTSVDVEGVRGLEVLDIRNNEIEALPAKIGLLGNLPGSKDKTPGKLRVLEVSGNRFRVPRLVVVEKGTEAVLRDLRRMIKAEEVTDEWREVL
jgi:Leucine-rich repeat (LRR) protein